MQFVTASDTAVLISAISSIVGSNCDAKAAIAIRAKPSLADLLFISRVISFSRQGLLYEKWRILC